MSLPHLLLIATGGTIAGVADSAADTTGYRAGSLGARALLDAVPEVHELARISLSQPFSLDSVDIGPSHWVQLAGEVRDALADPELDGVVITHGTDTLEETAYFLDRVLAPGKPVVMTCAMRPASARSADGPMNLLQAVGVAASRVSQGLGVVAVINDRIHCGARLRKAHTQSLDAFDHGDSAIGWARPPRIECVPTVPARHPGLLQTMRALPRVDVLWVGAGSDPDLLAAAIAHGARGVILALPGNGTVPASWLDAIAMAQQRGIRVLRSTRTGAGAVAAGADEAAPATALGVSQARVELMLALTREAAGCPAE